jgi:hypothetical protein
MREHRERYGREAAHIDEVFQPLMFESANCAVCPDWHIPFHDIDFFEHMLRICNEYDVRDLAIPGDFWDCDNYSRFVHLSWGETFRQEIENVRDVLEILTSSFDNIYFCRGNHEKRWIDGNLGMMGMKELFYVTGIVGGYKLTLDDHLVLKNQGGSWLLCHPRNFRQANLSVARDLAAKYQMNVFCAHGHQWADGKDRSGKLRLIDGGGMFDPAKLEYLRNTSTFPAVQGGFVIIQEKDVLRFPNDKKLIELGGE